MTLVTFILIAASLFVAIEARPPSRYLPRQHEEEVFATQHAPQGRRLQATTSDSDDILRNDLLKNYDRGSYPWKYAWNTTEGSLRQGVPIQVGINFHRVFSVDIINSVADLIVWFRQQWVDPRLAWDPSDYNGTTTTWFWIENGVGSGEASEIWTPDTELWNMASSLKETLTDSYAAVSSDGTVFWSRPGHMRPACKFQGLDSFPFDRLSCTMELGSWSYSGLYIRPVKMGGTGYSIGGSETAGEAFSEYQLAKEDAVVCRENVYPPFPGAPEEDWPVLLYDVTFNRSWEPYARGYLVTQVILNLAGFATFWLPPQCGERISLAITAMLAAVASELVVAASLPSSSEITWFQTFSLFSLTFAAIALFESVAVLFFFYYTGSDLVPSWWKWLQVQYTKRRELYKGKRRTKKQQQQNNEERDEQSVDNDENDVDHDTNGAPENGITVGVGVEESEESWKGHVKFKNDDSAPFTACAQTDSNTQQQQQQQQHERRPSNIMNPRDADDFNDDLQAENNKRWKLVASRIDQFFRFVVVTIYIIMLAILVKRTERSG